MNAMIVCGGLSTRLGDITKETPKVLLEIGPRTVLDWQLLKLKKIGIDTVVLAAGHLSEVLREQAGEERLGVKLIYAIEPEKFGTGGAVKFAWKHLPNPVEPSFVINGDVLATVPLQDMLAQLDHTSDGMILGTRVEDASSYGTLEYDEDKKLLAFKEKEGKAIPGYINASIYVLTSSFLQYFPEHDAFSMEYDVFPHAKKLYVHESEHPWIDVGVPERLEWAKNNWQQFDV